MVNHLSKFAPNLAERTKTKSLQELLNKKNHWVWGELQREAFQEIKQALVLSPILALFDPNCETVVSAYASSYGLRAVLLQKQLDELKPIAYISRSLTPTKQHYAQIERNRLHSLGHVNDCRIKFLGLPSEPRQITSR